MIQKIDSEREIDIEMIGARELWIGAVDQYRPRGRVDLCTEMGIEIGREMGIEREQQIKKKWVEREREREREREHVYKGGS